MFTKKDAANFCKENGYHLIVSPFSHLRDGFIYSFTKGKKTISFSGIKGIAFVIGNAYGTCSFETLEEALASIKAYL